MIKSDNSAAMLLGSILFHFDTGNHVEYLVHVVNPVLGDDGYKLTRHWTQDGVLTVVSLGYYENVTAAIKFALEAWEGYIMKGEMPECIVTGALDAEDVRDMMLYIQEPELWEGDEISPMLDAIEIDPVDLAIEAMSSAVDMLRGKLALGALDGEVFNVMIDLESSLELIVSLRAAEWMAEDGE